MNRGLRRHLPLAISPRHSRPEADPAYAAAAKMKSAASAGCPSQVDTCERLWNAVITPVRIAREA